MLVVRIVRTPHLKAPCITHWLVDNEAQLDSCLVFVFHHGWPTPENKTIFKAWYGDGTPLFLIMDYEPDLIEGHDPGPGLHSVHLTTARGWHSLGAIDDKSIFSLVKEYLDNKIKDAV